MDDRQESFQHGLLLGLSRLRVDAPAVLRRVAGGEGLVRAWDDLGRQGLEAAASRLASWADELVPACPPELENVDVSWLREALAGEPEDLLAAVAATVPEVARGAVGETRASVTAPAVLPSVATDFCWSWLGHLADVRDAGGAGPGGAAASAFASLAELAGVELLAAMRERGAEELGVSLAGADAPTLARAMTAVGAPWARFIAVAAARGVDRPRRALAQLRVARASTVDAADPLERLAIIGTLAVRDAVDRQEDTEEESRNTAGAPARAKASRAWLAVLAHRLPVSVGRLLVWEATPGA